MILLIPKMLQSENLLARVGFDPTENGPNLDKHFDNLAKLVKFWGACYERPGLRQDGHEEARRSVARHHIKPWDLIFTDPPRPGGHWRSMSRRNTRLIA